MISSLITQKVLEGKIFFYSVLESLWDKQQEYAIKSRFYSRNYGDHVTFKWLQGQIIATIWWLPSNYITFETFFYLTRFGDIWAYYLK